MPPLHPGLKRRLVYLWAPVTVGLALAVRMMLTPQLGTAVPYATFYLAVLCAAVLGGPGPGILAVILSAVTAVYFLIEPIYALALPGTETEVGLGLFLAVSGLIVIVTDAMRRAKLRADNAARLAEERRAQLETEVQLRVRRKRPNERSGSGSRLPSRESATV